MGKVHPDGPDETGEILGRSQADTIPCLLQTSAQDDTGLDIAL